MVSSYLQLLRRRYHGQLDEDADEFIDYAVEGAGRMRALIEDLLAYSRAGRAAEPTPIDAELVAGDVISSLAAVIAEARAHVYVEPLPMVLGDRLALAQVLQNLISNALKFRRPEVSPVVTVTAELSGENVKIVVSDNGIGFESRYNRRIFRVFERLHGRSEYPGTGIGLALCRKIAERHGGMIVADGEPGVGSTFTVTLPLRHASIVAAALIDDPAVDAEAEKVHVSV
jgi:light-regulated signal transduction histidine kinase (bacteriophytochrome)